MTRSRQTLTRKDARTYLRIGITPNEIVRLRWPGVTDAQAGFILWERTPFPLVDGLDDIADMIADLPALGTEDTERQEASR